RGAKRNRALRWPISLIVGSSLIAACASAGTDVSIERSDRAAPSTSMLLETSIPSETSESDPLGTTTTVPFGVPTATDGSSVDPSVPASEPDSVNGTSGIGDALFPDLGNRGIDVTHYDIDLVYDPDSTVITATATLSIDITEALDVFTLDQIGLTVDDVTIDGSSVAFEVADPELIITPAEPLSVGTSIAVAVAYVADGTTSISSAGVSSGWFPTPLGSFTLNEPDGARTWLPSNDHPSDKATYHFTIHVPDGDTAIANGALISNDADPAGGITWVWDQPEPMTTYVIQVLTGPYTVVTGVTDEGLALVSAILQGDESLMQPFLDVTPQQIDFFEEYFGPYPFDSYGIAMTDVNFGGAMEEQGRSLFGRDDFGSGQLGYVEELLLAHELSHQWFGNAVAPARWRDIWLNESFASYAEWMWLDHAGYITLSETADDNLGSRQDGSIATGDPSQRGLFGYEVYEGGAVVLHALRSTVGDDVFFEILQRWVADNRNTSRTTDDFIATAETVSGLDLTQFFADWLYATDLPDSYPS
ncbi:MAG: M1 family metallopeptidase, partial [Ilumatobacteraceae bacterium]